jgi:CheY-like chemotaxis protein
MRILLADDQALVRGGFRLILDAEPDIDVVAEAGDGQEAVARAVETTPDLVLMDIRMPKLDGIQATRQLLAQLDATRVLILTTFDLDEYVVDAFRAGGVRIPAQDRTAPPAGRCCPHRLRWRRPAGTRKHPPADRAIRPTTQQLERSR